MKKLFLFLLLLPTLLFAQKSVPIKVRSSFDSTVLNPYKKAYYTINQALDSSYVTIQSIDHAQIDTIKFSGGTGVINNAVPSFIYPDITVRGIVTGLLTFNPLAIVRYTNPSIYPLFSTYTSSNPIGNINITENTTSSGISYISFNNIDEFGCNISLTSLNINDTIEFKSTNFSQHGLAATLSGTSIRNLFLNNYLASIIVTVNGCNINNIKIPSQWYYNNSYLTNGISAQFSFNSSNISSLSQLDSLRYPYISFSSCNNLPRKLLMHTAISNNISMQNDSTELINLPAFIGDTLSANVYITSIYTLDTVLIHNMHNGQLYIGNSNNLLYVDASTYDSIAYAGAYFQITNNPLLTKILWPSSMNWQTFRNSGATVQAIFSGNALDQTTVDNIIISFASLNGSGGKGLVFTGQLDLSGGTNSPPSAASASALASLIAQGATVTHN